MKSASLIILSTALALAVPVSARTHKKHRAQHKEIWPEEIPDFGPNPDSICTAPVMDISLLTDEQLVDYFMNQPIMGPALIEAEAMQRFVARHNPDFNIDIAKAYIAVGTRYGIKGDIALCQSILETGWFRFADGTGVTADQHNYCGLGVLSRGQRGHTFNSIEDGVTAQIQHLYAYAGTGPLPDGEPLIDPRFTFVARGVAPTWSELSGRWAANDKYARSILKLYVELLKFSTPNQQLLQQ